MKYLMHLTVEEFRKMNEKHISEIITKKIARDSTLSEGEILDIEEAAKFLKLSKSTLYTLTSQQKIPHMKRYKRIYFYRKSLIKWLEEGNVEPI